MAAPGKYTVRLTVDGETYSQAFEIVRDPSTHATNAELEAGLSLQLRIRDDINSVSAMVNLIESMRKQMEDMGKKIRERCEQGRAAQVGCGDGSEDAERRI